MVDTYTLQAMADLLNPLNDEIQKVNSLVTSLLPLVDEVKELKNAVADLQPLKKEVKELKSAVSSLQEDTVEIKSNLRAINEHLERIENKTNLIEMTIDKEIRPNIHEVAKGHLELRARLDDAIQLYNDKELIHLRMNTLENDLRIIKFQLAQ